MSIKRGIDYYSALGLTPNATPFEIKNAYRMIALQSNPEKGGSNQVILFRLIGEAYEVLSDPLLRTLYDQFGEERIKEGIRINDRYIPPYAYHGDPSRTYKEFFGTASPYADLLHSLQDFHGLFSKAKEKIEKKKQPSLIKPLALTLEEVYFGTTKKVKMNRRVLSGDNDGTTEVKEHIFTFNIKPGLPSGSEITFPEAGDMSFSTIPGDIIFVTEDKPHTKFIREGTNLIMYSNISLHKALTGSIIEVLTLDGRLVRINLTKIVTPDYSYVVRGEGMPYVEDPLHKGDLLIKFNVEFPQHLPKSSTKLIIKALTGSSLMPFGSPEHINQLVLADKVRRFSQPVKTNKSNEK